MRKYIIKPRWFDGQTFIAPSAAKGKYLAYKAVREALGRNITFPDFLNGLSVLHMGRASESDRLHDTSRAILPREAR